MFFPIVCEVGILREVIHQGEARATGPAKDFHFVEEIGPEGFGGIDDVDDSSALEDGAEEFAFIGVAVLASVVIDERGYGIDAGGGIVLGVMGFEPGKGFRGVREAGGIDELNEGFVVDDEGNVL